MPCREADEIPSSVGEDAEGDERITLPFAFPALFDLDAQVNVDEALRYLKYRGQILDDGIVARLSAAKELCETLRPKGIVRSAWVKSGQGEDRVEVVTSDGLPSVPAEMSCIEDRRDRQMPTQMSVGGSGLVLSGQAIGKFLRDAPGVALITVTLGAESERLLRREQALDPVAGLLVDACASSLVESATDDLQTKVNEAMATVGLVGDKRFSPGYSDLPLTIQRSFVHAIEADKLLGLSVTESDMLIPAKSITAIVRLRRIGQT